MRLRLTLAATSSIAESDRAMAPIFNEWPTPFAPMGAKDVM